MPLLEELELQEDVEIHLGFVFLLRGLHRRRLAKAKGLFPVRSVGKQLFVFFQRRLFPADKTLGKIVPASASELVFKRHEQRVIVKPLVTIQERAVFSGNVTILLRRKAPVSVLHHLVELLVHRGVINVARILAPLDVLVLALF